METKLLNYLSEDRLKLYLDFAKGDLKKAIILYNINIKVSESFHTSLDYFEIVFRNVVNIILIKKYGLEWYNNSFLLEEQKDSICYVKNELKKLNKDINNSNIISNLSFGFWTKLFSSNYENKLKFLYSNILDNKISRAKMYNKIMNIKELRNRIAHRENIIKYNFMKVYGTILELISIIDEDMSKYINSISRTKQILNDNKLILAEFLNFNKGKPAYPHQQG